MAASQPTVPVRAYLAVRAQCVVHCLPHTQCEKQSYTDTRSTRQISTQYHRIQKLGFFEEEEEEEEEERKRRKKKKKKKKKKEKEEEKEEEKNKKKKKTGNVRIT